MRYLIDTGNSGQACEALEMGLSGVTSNPAMYAKNKTTIQKFVKDVFIQKPMFISAEVMGSLEEMEQQAKWFAKQYPGIVIKVNFSGEGLKLTRKLAQKGIPVAITLIFSVEQASLAMQAGAEYLFVFVSRNDETGEDGLEIVQTCMNLKKEYPKAKIVAASVRNKHQIRMLERMNADYAAVSWELVQKLMEYEPTVNGEKEFMKYWESVR